MSENTPPLESAVLEVLYKGDRTYLQGGDLYTASAVRCEAACGPGFLEQLAFRSFAAKETTLHLGTPGSNDRAFATGRYRTASEERIEFFLQEGEGDVPGRYPFDEEHLVSGARIEVERKHASLDRVEGYSPIEHFIALTKKLHYALKPDVQGKWVFSGLEIDRALSEDTRCFEVTIQRLISGRFSRSTIRLDGHEAGTIQFMVGTP